ncbi:MAG: DegT/DnrJ/EryC1/StrS family aminotransferase, partial [Bdellovibrionota bacterium]
MLEMVFKNWNFLKDSKSLQDSFVKAIGNSEMSLVCQKEDQTDLENQISFRIYDKFGNKKNLVSIEFSEEKLKVDWASSEFDTSLICVLGEYFLNELMVDQFIISQKNYSQLGSPIDSFEFINQADSILVKNKNMALGEELILTAGPSISAKERFYGFDAVKSGWNNNWATYLTEFEKSFAEYVGSKYALATSSCTGALHLSLLALGIGEGDEVLVPELTWVASASVIRYVGAKPIFVDVDPKTWCIDVNDMQKKINSKTKAIVPVHLYGFVANMGAIMELAQKHSLKVVEDAAPAIGATYGDKKVGGFGDVGCFSFQGAKLTVTGEGGMLVTDNEEVFEKIKSFWNHGRKPGPGFWIDRLGYKYKMSNVQAALGLGQLQRVDELITSKTRIYNKYFDRLSGCDQIEFQEVQAGTSSIYWMSSIKLSANSDVSRESMRTKLLDRKIDSRDVFPCISQYPIWGYEPQINLNANEIGTRGINLPSGVLLRDDE